MKTADCIFEIGVEEIPARFLPVFEQELATYVDTTLAENLLQYKNYTLFSTPRRIGILIHDLAEEQSTQIEEVIGPPAHVAFTPEKNPTKALEGFLHKTGASIDTIYEVHTERGKYIAAKVQKGGGSVIDLLPSLLHGAIIHLSDIQKMRWGTENVVFARPIRWIVALYGTTPIPCAYGSLQNNGVQYTYGHRIYAPHPIAIPAAEEYLRIITETGHIMPTTQERRRYITECMQQIANTLNAHIVPNDALLEEVVNLCEYPSVMLGDVDARFLTLPKEIFLTSIEVHQRSFGLVDDDGVLLPHFITITNNDPDKNPLIRTGWEKVLRARLEDALFFYMNDLKVPLKTWLEALEDVTFIAKLGSMKEKSLRLKALTTHFAHHIDPALKNDVARAALFSKVDLLSEVVGEFDTLQGTMGSIYAKYHGEDDVVATAIREHYLPNSATATLPKTSCGILLSLADKLDLIVGCFGMNLVSTGTTDPHGLRRAMLGIIRILLEYDIKLPLADSLQYAYTLYGERPWHYTKYELLQVVKQFYKTRVKQYLLSLGYESPFIDAVLGVRDSLYAQYQRLQALVTFMQNDDAVATCLLFKRIVNIVEKELESDEYMDTPYDTSLFQNEAEHALHTLLENVMPTIQTYITQGKYLDAMLLTKQFVAPLQTLFDTTMILDENMTIRKNRLYLLQTLRKNFASIVNFTALQV